MCNWIEIKNNSSSIIIYHGTWPELVQHLIQRMFFQISRQLVSDITELDSYVSIGREIQVKHE